MQQYRDFDAGTSDKLIKRELNETGRIRTINDSRRKITGPTAGSLLSQKTLKLRSFSPIKHIEKPYNKCPIEP